MNHDLTCKEPTEEKGERMGSANVIERDRFGGWSVMVWVGISSQGKTELVTIIGNFNALRYCDDVVSPVIVPYINNGNADVLQQDNQECAWCSKHRRPRLALKIPGRGTDRARMDYLG